MIDRVHGDTTIVGSPTEPAFSPRLAQRYVLVVQVTHLPDRRVAIDMNLAHLTRRQLDLGVLALFGHQLRSGAGTANELATTADLEERGRIGRELNDMLTKDSNIIVPLVDRGRVSAHANSLGGVILNTWDSELWNIADWYRIPE